MSCLKTHLEKIPYIVFSIEICFFSSLTTPICQYFWWKKKWLHRQHSMPTLLGHYHLLSYTNSVSCSKDSMPLRWVTFKEIFPFISSQILHSDRTKSITYNNKVYVEVCVKVYLTVLFFSKCSLYNNYLAFWLSSTRVLVKLSQEL